MQDCKRSLAFKELPGITSKPQSLDTFSSIPNRYFHKPWQIGVLLVEHQLRTSCNGRVKYGNSRGGPAITARLRAVDTKLNTNLN